MTVAAKFAKLRVWTRGGQRAPHKPLLVLYALGRWSRGDRGPIPFREVNRDLTPLLQEFGPPRRSYHPELPFWHLASDGVWEIQTEAAEPTKTRLLADDATGSFSPEVQKCLTASPDAVRQIATTLLDGHFPESLHQDILDAVGLSFDRDIATRKRRDPKFRQRILTAYEYRCAVCGFDVRIGSVSIALDAAHIRWHQAGGPDEETNGLALCVLHHKIFDLGAITVTPTGVVLVSDQVHGTDGFDSILRHHSGKVRRPQRADWHPQPDHLEWHAKQVFKGESRPDASDRRFGPTVH